MLVKDVSGLFFLSLSSIFYSQHFFFFIYFFILFSLLAYIYLSEVVSVFPATGFLILPLIFPFETNKTVLINIFFFLVPSCCLITLINNPFLFLLKTFSFQSNFLKKYKSYRFGWSFTYTLKYLLQVSTFGNCDLIQFQ